MDEPSEKLAEAEALKHVLVALESQPPETRSRILEYAAKSYGLDLLVAPPYYAPPPAPALPAAPAPAPVQTLDHVPTPATRPNAPELDGVNEIAVKWIVRNALSPTKLADIFSLNGDAIDLIAQTVPGKGKRDRLHKVFLLEGIAAYLSGGVAKIDDEKLRQTAQHYDAYDVTNFSKHLASFEAEFSGAKEAGYTLSARGLAQAATLLKEMAGV